MEGTAEAVEAVVLENDDGKEDDAVAAVVDETTKAKTAPAKKGSATSSSASLSAGHKNTNGSRSPSVPQSKKRMAAEAMRNATLPPMSSPGLLVPHGTFRGRPKGELVSPNALFTQAMATAGYTFESRTKNFHRGSSVQRVIDDMYDSDVKFCLSFPKLVPDKYLQLSPSSDASITTTDRQGAKTNSTTLLDPTSTTEIHPAPTAMTEPSTTSETATGGETKLNTSIAQRFIKVFESRNETSPSNNTDANRSSTGRKRGRIKQFFDMAPLSLTLAYPEEYIQKRLEYVKKVNEREEAIIAFQEDQWALEIAREKHDSAEGEYTGPTTSKIVIPPIPVPPDPPKLSDMQGLDVNLFDDQHPLYPPKNQFVEHLDKRCFHITEGRYFGLNTNYIADPHFVGTSAPRIGGLNQSSATVLATGSSETGVPLLVASAVAAGPRIAATTTHAKIISSNSKKAPAVVVKPNQTKNGEASKKTQRPPPSKVISKPAAAVTSGTKVAKKVSSSSSLPKTEGLVAATAADLRAIMEAGDETSDQMRWVIIRAAVHAARGGKHDSKTSCFVFRNKAYPDVCKAFSTYAGLKPCAQCKTNKQGTFLCRLTRRHSEPDFDGEGNSWEQVAPLFKLPMECLIIPPSKTKAGSTPL
jgi:hypothetical protein